MLKRSFSERCHTGSRGHSGSPRHPAHVMSFGVKVLPSTFEMPSLRVTGIDVKNPLLEDSTGYRISNGHAGGHYHESNGEAIAQHGKDPRGRQPSDVGRYINSHSFDYLDLEELTESERDLKIDYELGRAEQNARATFEVAEAERRRLLLLGLPEQDRKLDEATGLDDILRMCTDYEHQLQRENQIRAKNASYRLKIKTNGSLTSPTVHVRRFAAELSREPYCGNWNLLPTTTTTTDWNGDGTVPRLERRSTEPDPEWTCRTADQLSSTSSSDFLDKLSPIRSQSFYENDDVFAAFQTDSSDCLTSDDALDESPSRRLPLEPSLPPPPPLPHSTLRSTETVPDEPTGQHLPTSACSESEDSAQGIRGRERNSGSERLDLELTKLRKTKFESTERIGRTKNRIIEVDGLQENLIHELESELEMLESESTEVLSSLRLEEERMAVIKDQQMELLMQAAKEREEFQQQIGTERRRLEELEEEQRETSRRLECSGSAETHPDLLQTLRKVKEAVETQQRTFDDLEFSLLELETRREEEKEPMQRKLAAELDSLLRLKSQREETLSLIKKQERDILHETNTDVTNLEKERHALMNAFRKERLAYLAIVEQMSRVAVKQSTSFTNGIGNGHREENGCGWETLPLSPSPSAGDDLCRTPPTKARIRQTLRNLEQEHRPSSVQRPKSARVAGVSGGRRSDSEGSQEVNGDVSPTSKVFSSASEDSSFNSFEGVAKETKEDGTRADVGSKSHDHLLFASGEERVNSQEGGGGGGGRALGRSLSEPRKTGRLEVNSSTNAAGLSAMTDEQIRYRENLLRTQARPLTRYLPVRDKTLDLRCFVESSGHSVDETPEVLVSVSTCCGYLKKRGGRFRTWHKRWFVFDRSRRCLTYYVDRSETKLRRSIYFQSIVDVFVDQLRTVVSPNQRLTFCLKTIDRRYYLVAPTPEAMRIWIDVLFTGAEGYQEFC